MKGTGKFVIATAALVLFTAACVTGTVISHAGRELRMGDDFYRGLERQYVRDVRLYLQEEGFPDSGVMLTSVVEGDGTRVYTLTVHNEGIERLSPGERDAIREALEKMQFEAPDSSFCQLFQTM